MPGQSCAPCECNGNVDPQEDGHCDTVTGQCLKCVGNTAGDHCEKCADGYYGDAVAEKSCRGKLFLLFSEHLEWKKTWCVCSRMGGEMHTFSKSANL